MSTMHYLLAKC